MTKVYDLSINNISFKTTKLLYSVDWQKNVNLNSTLVVSPHSIFLVISNLQDGSLLLPLSYTYYDITVLF